MVIYSVLRVDLSVLFLGHFGYDVFFQTSLERKEIGGELLVTAVLDTPSALLRALGQRLLRMLAVLGSPSTMLQVLRTLAE